MKFGEINLEKIAMRGYNKTLVIRNGQLVVGGSTKNMIVYQPILKDKIVKEQYSDQEVWVIEVSE